MIYLTRKGTFFSSSCLLVLSLSQHGLLSIHKPWITYEQACNTTLAALTPFGKTYCEILRKGLEEQRWVDVYKTPGKQSLPYTGGPSRTHPFVLINFQHDIPSMYSLAHELGHAMHSYFARITQPYHYGVYGDFVAEVASHVHENLLTHYLLKASEGQDERILRLSYILQELHQGLYRQTMVAEFERDIHNAVEQHQTLTADKLTEMYTGLNEQYYGTGAVVDELVGIGWTRQPYFYSQPFLAYQYATGCAASSALSWQILHEGQPAVDCYLEFLKAGASDYPLELLKKAGVDMAKPEPVEQTCKLFESYLLELEELLDKRQK